MIKKIFIICQGEIICLKFKKQQQLQKEEKSKKVAGLVQEALDSGATAPEILNAMIDSMTVVGDKFTKNEIFVPEMLVAARAMQKGVEVLKPLLVGDNAVSAGK